MPEQSNSVASDIIETMVVYFEHHLHQYIYNICLVASNENLKADGKVEECFFYMYAQEIAYNFLEPFWNDPMSSNLH